MIIKKSTSSFILIILISLCLFFTLSNPKLIYLLQIARHGSKYPSKNITASIDPPSLKGQLTGVGMRQQYLLGTYLYEDYIRKEQLISGKLNARQVQVYASSYQRAIDSAYSQTYGLFQNINGHVIPDGFNSNLLNPPFTIQSNLKKQNKQDQNKEQLSQSFSPNYALTNGFQPPAIIVDDSIINYCPNYGLFYSQRLKQISKNLTTFQSQHSLQITKLVLAFNISSLYATIPGMSDLYDNVISNINLGRQLPKNIDQNDIKSLRYFSDYYNLMLQASYFGQTLSTPLLKYMINKFTTLQSIQSQKKLTIFSCHAQNIFELLHIVNITSIQCLTQKYTNKNITTLNCMNSPDFAANLLFEIHQNQETFNQQVKVKYNGQYAYLCEKKQYNCQINQFINRLSKYVRNDYEKQCGVIKQSLKNEINKQSQSKSSKLQSSFLQLNAQNDKEKDNSEKKQVNSQQQHIYYTVVQQN